MRKINLVFIDDELSNQRRVNIIKRRHDDDDLETFCFDESDKGLDFIKDNKNPIILVLDLKMRDHEKQGIEILKEFRKTRNKLPVIIRSGNNEITNDEFRELINNHIAYFIKKATGNKSKEVSQEKEYIEKAKRFIYQNVSVALQEYIERRKDRNEVRIVSKSGSDSIPLADLLDEVNQRSKTGLDFEKAIYKMSIELLTKKVD